MILFHIALEMSQHLKSGTPGCQTLGDNVPDLDQECRLIPGADAGAKLMSATRRLHTERRQIIKLLGGAQ